MAPYTIQAVSVVCGTAGQCRLIERTEKLAEKKLRLHNALANVKPRRDFILHLINISDKQVNLPKGYAIGLAEPYAGPTYDIKENDLLADVGADPLCVAGPTEDQPRMAAPLASAEAQGLETSGPLQHRAKPDQEPSVLTRSGDRGWGTTVKWLSGLSLCVCVRTCFVGCLSKAPLFPSRALLK